MVKLPMYLYQKADPPCLLGLEAIQKLGLITLSPSVVVRQATETGKESPPVVAVQFVAAGSIFPIVAG